MFNLHNNFWQLADGRIWSGARAAYVPEDDADYTAWLAADNMPSRAPDVSGAVSEQGLREALRFYELPLGELAGPEERRAEILARLAEIDTASVRPLRAVAAGEATEFDHNKLAALDAEAAELRTELAGLGQT
jgi:hypothetical protein